MIYLRKVLIGKKKRRSKSRKIVWQVTYGKYYYPIKKEEQFVLMWQGYQLTKAFEAVDGGF